jgi:hypothetical protein
VSSVLARRSRKPHVDLAIHLRPSGKGVDEPHLATSDPA